jgi:undecaprenyl-diphosphatase
LEIIQAIVLGIVQGLTEFIPVSSSAHLVLVPFLLGWPQSSLLFDTMLHWGTLLAVLVVFWRDFLRLIAAWVQSILHFSLADPNARLAWYIIVATIPAVVVGFLFKDRIESVFADPIAVGFFMLVTAAILAGSEVIAKRLQQPRTLEQATWVDSIVIGLAQAVALLPGVSRSGSTIGAGLACGIRRDLAARFSFWLGTPAIFAAGMLQLVEVVTDESAQAEVQILPMIFGFAAAAIVGVLTIRFLLSYLRTRTLYIFSAYCLFVGLGIIAFSFMS